MLQVTHVQVTHVSTMEHVEMMVLEDIHVFVAKDGQEIHAKYVRQLSMISEYVVLYEDDFCSFCMNYIKY